MSQRDVQRQNAVSPKSNIKILNNACPNTFQALFIHGCSGNSNLCLNTGLISP